MGVFTNAIYLNSKFFGNPSGSKAPPKQSKLSFSSKSTSNGAPSSSASKENEDVDMNGPAKTEATPKVEEDAVDAKENVKPGTGRSLQSRKVDNIC
jgi:DNA ligase-1